MPGEPVGLYKRSVMLGWQMHRSGNLQQCSDELRRLRRRVERGLQRRVDAAGHDDKDATGLGSDNE